MSGWSATETASRPTSLDRSSIQHVWASRIVTPDRGSVAMPEVSAVPQSMGRPQCPAGAESTAAFGSAAQSSLGSGCSAHTRGASWRAAETANCVHLFECATLDRPVDSLRVARLQYGASRPAAAALSVQIVELGPEFPRAAASSGRRDRLLINRPEWLVEDLG